MYIWKSDFCLYHLMGDSSVFSYNTGFHDWIGFTIEFHDTEIEFCFFFQMYFDWILI